MDLYMKAGPNTTVGDCPFAQYIRMVLEVKGLKYHLHPCTPEQKPDWLTVEFEGKMPCLDDNGIRKIESSTIAGYIDDRYPDPPLQKSFDEELTIDAQKATAQLFPSLAKFLKNKEFDYYAEKALIAALKEFETFLATKATKTDGDFLLGDRIALMDCSLTPKLYILDEAVRHYYPDTHKKVVGEFPLAQRYMKFMWTNDAFLATKYSPATMIWGWDIARNDVNNSACGV